MDSSSAPCNGHSQALSKEREYSSFRTTQKHPSLRQTQLPSPTSSFSSSSSSSLSSPDNSPKTHLQFSRIPFSWEKLPGVPKKQFSRKKDPSLEALLPLPPSAGPNSSKRVTMGDIIRIRRKKPNESIRRDPFFAAFLECSKDDDGRERSLDHLWKAAGVSRSSSDWFGFASLPYSCKRACSVSDSIMYIPRSSNNAGEVWHRRSH
ncbi:uncharacterized protein LOC131161501 [Malania oleifera]|uniref:uncharacterized protein LOC131161501 n=1 Tax=Malania oleifera TaxID=397392 RepID=UPI0025AE43D8|nr:uncharacterized protein LOC131161501 [Malania oleifera]